jgi:hypothetical protein
LFNDAKIEWHTAYSLANFAFEKADLQKMQLKNNQIVFDSKSEDYTGFAAKYLPI